VANTIEPSVCGDDAALCQITLTTCYCDYERVEGRVSLRTCLNMPEHASATVIIIIIGSKQ